MGSSFDRWEKDPFFSAAEEVQESADRMESTYRTWIHAKKDPSSEWDAEQLHRDLHTALGTTKWQLDEFQRAVRSSYDKSLSDDAKDRHREFIVAIEDQVAKIEKSLKDTAHSEGKGTPRWVRLDEGERNELALFLSGLSGPFATEDKMHSTNHTKVNELLEVTDKESVAGCSKNSSNLVDCVSLEAREEKPHGHRRTASATADSGAWKISISDDTLLRNSSNEQPPRAPRKIPSLSGFLNYMDSTPNGKWSKNCFRKWKATDRQQESDAMLLPTQSNRQVINSCYEKCKSCLECEDCYDKQLHGWYGAMQRQLQRSQYQMQYSKPVQVTIWILLLLFLIVLIAVHTI